MATGNTNSVSFQDRTLLYQCWLAFKERDYNEAIRLLPLVKEPRKVHLRGYQIVYDRRANLLHLSSGNGCMVRCYKRTHY